MFCSRQNFEIYFEFQRKINDKPSREYHSSASDGRTRVYKQFNLRTFYLWVCGERASYAHFAGKGLVMHTLRGKG